MLSFYTPLIRQKPYRFSKVFRGYEIGTHGSNGLIRSRSSHQRCCIKKFVLKNSQNSQENTCARVSFLMKLQAFGVVKKFAKITGYHIRQSLFSNKIAGLRPATLLKKRLWQSCFPVTFAKFLRTPFL